MSLVNMVRQLLTSISDYLPMSVSEFEEHLNGIHCTAFEDFRLIYDHGDYVSDVINEDCLDEDEEEFCDVYSITRYKLAWLGLTCGEHKVVAVLRNLVVMEKNVDIHTIAHYELLNVVENEKLYEIVRNGDIAKAISKRKLMELVETSAKVAPEIAKAFTSIAMLGVALNAIKQALEEGAK